MMNHSFFEVRQHQPRFVLICLQLSLIVLTNIHCFAQTDSVESMLEGKWNLNLNHHSVGDVQFIMNFETNKNQFKAYSKTNADRNILGFWNSFLARSFTQNFKKGSLVRIENGNFKTSNDTLYLKGKMISTLGEFVLEGFILNENLQSTLKYSNRKIAGSISGNRIIPDLPLRDYKALFEDIEALTKNKIYNKDVLQSKGWKTFSNEMNSATDNFQDDLDIIFAFYYYSQRLPFSHYTLTRSSKVSTNNQNEKHLTLKQKNTEIAYLRITSFNGSSQEVDSIFNLIHQNNYRYLIVDLRNNSGGNVEAGLAFGSHVINSKSYGGIFLTQNWFNTYSHVPKIQDYENFQHFTKANNDLLLQGIHQYEGLCLKIIPKEEVYNGKLFILINKNTASTCEPMVYELKKQERAIIIGETTAGSMLNSETFVLNEKFEIKIPTADYYTSDGYRIDQNGVEPNIKTNSNDALKTAFEKINSLQNN